jgi:hypothetical protein
VVTDLTYILKTQDQISDGAQGILIENFGISLSLYAIARMIGLPFVGPLQPLPIPSFQISTDLVFDTALFNNYTEFLLPASSYT